LKKQGFFKKFSKQCDKIGSENLPQILKKIHWAHNLRWAELLDLHLQVEIKIFSSKKPTPTPSQRI
jgi:hypothetical protein